MPTIAQCLAYAAEYKAKAKDGLISARRSSVLSNISRSWAALANQLANLAGIIKDEGR